MTTEASLCAIDLFSGCGGLTLGLEAAGFNVLAAIEMDLHASSTYELNHPHVLTIKEDITTVSPRLLREALRLQGGELDLLAGCPPCQGFSTLRTRNGNRRNRDQRNGLIAEILRYTIEFLPKAVMMENVPGLSGKTALRELCAGLEELGYIPKYSIRDARRFGVPQRRRRLMLLAGRGFEIPFACESKAAATVRQCIADLPQAGNSGDKLHDLGERRTEAVRNRIAAIPKDGGSRSALGAKGQLACHNDFDGFKDIYGRMTWDDVAPTITGGCFNPSKGRFLHPEEDRCITMREAALLQGFPRSYKFDLSAGKQRIALMIGNALPAEFIRRHARNVRAAILGSESTNAVPG